MIKSRTQVVNISRATLTCIAGHVPSTMSSCWAATSMIVMRKVAESPSAALACSISDADPCTGFHCLLRLGFARAAHRNPYARCCRYTLAKLYLSASAPATSKLPQHAEASNAASSALRLRGRLCGGSTDLAINNA